MFTHDSTESSTTRKRVIEAARTVMADRGIARVRIDAVAKEAGLSAGALYRHFSGREDLLLAVILDSAPRNELPDMNAGTEPRELLKSLVSEVYAHEERMASITVTLLADESLSAQFRELLAQAPGGPDEYPKGLAKSLDALQQREDIPLAKDTLLCAMNIQARCFHHATLERLHGPSTLRGTQTDLVEQLIDDLTQ